MRPHESWEWRNPAALPGSVSDCLVETYDDITFHIRRNNRNMCSENEIDTCSIGVVFRIRQVLENEVKLYTRTYSDCSVVSYYLVLGRKIEDLYKSNWVSNNWAS